MIYTVEQRIQKAARELQAALNDGDADGKRYVGRIEVGRYEAADGPTHGYVVRVTEITEREVA